MNNREVLLFALGIHNGWDPLEWFKGLKQKLPLARIVGFAVPTKTDNSIIKRWKREPRATLGVYGWRGVSFEMFDWTLGESYLKLRNTFANRVYEPYLFPPDGSLSNEAVVALSIGDPEYGLPPLVIVGERGDVMTYPPKVNVVGYAKRHDEPGAMGLFISERTDIRQFEKILLDNAPHISFSDVHKCVEAAKGSDAPEIKEVSL